jgi:thiol-disulfide isomerase/thioredoxin
VVTHNKEFRLGERKFNMGQKSLNGYEIKKLWRNEDGLHFSDVSIATGAGDLHDARGFAACDFDHDGDLDFFVRNYKANSILLRHEGMTNRWLAVRPRGARGNRDAIGARVEIEADGKTQVRWITCGTGYLSQMPNEAYFGLGAAAQADRLRVVWPDGTAQEFGSVPADTRVQVTEGKDGFVEIPVRPQPLLSPVDEGRGDPTLAALAGANLRDASGAKADLAKLGSSALVTFWASWCNVCRSEFAELNRIRRDYGRTGLKVVAVAVADPQGPDPKKTAAELGAEFEIWTISRAEYDRVFGADAAVPRTLVADHGRVSYVHVGKSKGYLLKSYLREAMRER